MGRTCPSVEHTKKNESKRVFCVNDQFLNKKKANAREIDDGKERKLRAFRIAHKMIPKVSGARRNV